MRPPPCPEVLQPPRPRDRRSARRAPPIDASCWATAAARSAISSAGATTRIWACPAAVDGRATCKRRRRGSARTASSPTSSLSRDYPSSASSLPLRLAAAAGKLIDLDVRPIRRLLAAGCIPLLYGDVCLDAAQGFCIISTETIFACLARRLEAGADSTARHRRRGVYRRPTQRSHGRSAARDRSPTTSTRWNRSSAAPMASTSPAACGARFAACTPFLTPSLVSASRFSPANAPACSKTRCCTRRSRSERPCEDEAESWMRCTDPVLPFPRIRIYTCPASARITSTAHVAACQEAKAVWHRRGREACPVLKTYLSGGMS